MTTRTSSLSLSSSQKSCSPRDILPRHLTSRHLLLPRSFAYMVVRAFAPTQALQEGRGTQGSYLNHKRVLPVRHLQGCGCPHICDSRAGDAESRPRCLGWKRTRSRFSVGRQHLSLPSRDSSFPLYLKGVRQEGITTIFQSCPQLLIQSQELALKTKARKAMDVAVTTLAAQPLAPRHHPPLGLTLGGTKNSRRLPPPPSPSLRSSKRHFCH